MTLQQLLYFKTACFYENISKAAEKLHIAQPSVSLAIKSLEKEFSVQLIKRQKIGFTLTREGEKLLDLATALLEQADLLSDRMLNEAQAHRVINIGIPPMTGAVLLPTLFSKLKKQNPEINVSFSEAGRRDLLEQLNSHQLDLAFIPYDNKSDLKDYNSVFVATLEDVCCVSADHRLASKDTLTLNDLADEPLTLFSDSFYHSDKMLLLFDGLGITPNVIHKTTQLSTMEELIKSNLAVGFLFKQIAEHISGVKAISVNPPIYTQIALIWCKNTPLNDDIKNFIAYF